MRVARVLTNETCNQACRFCSARRPSERREFILAGAVKQRIDAAIADGAREIILTGGEPTMRRDLADLVRYARARGASRVVLETNAALISNDLARSLVEAGLDAARVHMPAFGPDADAITRDEGGFVATLAGLRALETARLTIEIAIPIVATNLSRVARIPSGLRDAGMSVSRMFVTVIVDGPDPASIANVADAAQAIASLEEAARTNGIPLQFDPSAVLPPCAFDKPYRVAHLYALTPGGGERPGFSRIDACAECLAEDRCPGVPTALGQRAMSHGWRPIREDRIRRKLTVISSTREQIRRELVTRDVHRTPTGKLVPSHIVRIHFHCNQACDFCFVSTHLPAPDDTDVRAAILEISHLGGVLQLSGGEPTLNGRVCEYVRLGKTEGAIGVELQTNAIQLADERLTQALEAAGLDVAFVSLHAARGEISDMITRAPGTFAKTVRGLDALSKTRIHVRLNFVFCEPNKNEFPDFVRLVATRWPKAEINVSIASAFTDLVPRTSELIPRYSDVLPALEQGLALAREANLTVLGFESMCGMPLCLAPVDKRTQLELAEIPAGHDGGEFVRTEACNHCDLATRCFGLRRSYAELHGTTEPRAVVFSDQPQRTGIEIV
ncbi:MAG TPA: radical SAM protein [Polyangium sp.]|nr:radical SAM protein [Polyangium sp.]